MDIATILAISNVLTKAVIAPFSPQFAKSLKSGPASPIIALFFAVAAISTGYALYVVVVKYAATGRGGTIGNNVRLGVCLLTIFVGLLLFYLRKTIAHPLWPTRIWRGYRPFLGRKPTCSHRPQNSFEMAAGAA